MNGNRHPLDSQLYIRAWPFFRLNLVLKMVAVFFGDILPFSFENKNGINAIFNFYLQAIKKSLNSSEWLEIPKSQIFGATIQINMKFCYQASVGSVATIRTIQKRAKQPWRSDTFSKVATLNSVCNFTKGITPLWVFFTFFKFYKCYQITQSVSNCPSDL